MKKVFFVLTLLFGMAATDIVMAQERYPVFSGALGGGSGGGVRRSFYRPGAVGGEGTPVQQKVQRTRKTVVRYAADQVDLTDKQMEKLMPMMKRLQEGKIDSLEVVGISKDYNITYLRLTSLEKVLSSYNPGFSPGYRDISGPAVIPSNDNTVEFIEYY